MQLVRKVKLAPALGYGANGMSSIVVVGRKAFVATFETDFFRPAIAVVDLGTFAVRPISIPDGYLYGFGGTPPNAAATPDGKYVVMVEDEDDGASHILFISTASNRVTHDYEVGTDPMGILVTPINKPGSIYGYVVGRGAGGLSATALDLNSGSPTFGQLLPATKVIINSLFYDPRGAAIDATGSRLLVTGFRNDPSGPQPNAVVIDTGLMFSDPTKAIVGTATVAGGALTQGATIATVVTTPPGSAPTVTGVSGNITNDAPHTIHVSGSNFASGALVRIGSMAPLTSQVNGPTDLEVTVPQNAPAAAELDVIVTNPGLAGPPAQQNQSGLLANGLTIFVTSSFQPDYQFASLNRTDGSLSVFSFPQRSMKQLPIAPPAVRNLAFNRDGAELYAATDGFKYAIVGPEAVAVSLATDSVEAVISIPGLYLPQSTMVAAGVNPVTLKPVVYEWSTATNDGWKVALSMIDTDPTSPTFNTVLQTLYAGSPEILGIYSGAATPDGKYVYVNYLDGSSYQSELAIFDVVHGTASTIPTSPLGVDRFQHQVYVAPDGQSLLLSAYLSNPVDFSAGPIKVLDIAADPKHPTLVTTIAGTPPL